MSLDAASYCQNERTLLLQLISDLCKNDNNSHNKKLRKSFFEDVKVSKRNLETSLTSTLQNKWSSMITINNEMRLLILKNKKMPCIAGYGLKKLFFKTKIECSFCTNFLLIGRGIITEQEMLIEYDISYLNLRNKGGLSYPK